VRNHSPGRAHGMGNHLRRVQGPREKPQGDPGRALAAPQGIAGRSGREQYPEGKEPAGCGRRPERQITGAGGGHETMQGRVQAGRHKEGRVPPDQKGNRHHGELGGFRQGGRAIP